MHNDDTAEWKDRDLERAIGLFAMGAEASKHERAEAAETAAVASPEARLAA